MKRLRIWINHFTLVQQFLAVVFLDIILLVFLTYGYLNKNVDTFVNNQMFSYIHREQNEFLQTREIREDSNAESFIYSINSERFLTTVPEEYEYIINNININPETDNYDDVLNYESTSIVYSIMTYDEYRLISFIKNDYRQEFRNALLNGVVNVTFYIVGLMFILILAWIFSFLKPLNQIKNYINKIRNNEKADLYLFRNDEIGEVGEALVSMSNELSKQQRIRDEMIQNISHDLKTPIATIKSYSESIKDGIYPYDTLEKSVDVIAENADRLEKKVYSLITYNKLGYLVDTDEGYLNLYMAPVIEKAILGAQVLRSDITIKTDLDYEVMFHGEEEPWRVVVENLLDNGLRYARSMVGITLNKNMLEVYNDGQTMEKDRLDKLFKPYEKGTKGNFGLGLSIVKKVCDTYGYIVTGENMSDGVVFRVYTNNKFKRKKTKKV